MNACLPQSDSRMASTSLLAVCLLAIANIGYASIVVTDYYRLGEHDAAATLHSPAAATQDSSGNIAGANALVRAKFGLEGVNPFPTYDDAFESSAEVKLGSTFSAYFDSVENNNGRFQTATPSTLALDNFGIEGWFVPEGTEATQAMVYNGYARNRGFGLFLHNGTYQAYLAGIGFIDTGVTANISDWTYFAMVRDNGVIRLYVNGVTPVVTMSNAGTFIPAQADDSFLIGSSARQGIPLGDVESGYNGNADEVRVFEFAPGGFDAGRDLLHSVPEPTTMLVFLVGLGACAGFSRAGRRAMSRP